MGNRPSRFSGIASSPPKTQPNAPKATIGGTNIPTFTGSFTQIAPNLNVRTFDIQSGGKASSSLSQAIIQQTVEGERLAAAASSKFGISLDIDTALRNTRGITESVRTGIPTGIVLEKINELNYYRSVNETFGLNLEREQIDANKQAIQAGLSYQTRKPSFSDTQITFDALSEENNKLVDDYNKTIEQIKEEKNPFIQQKRIREELDPLGSRITEIQSDYTKLGETVQQHKPKLVEVSDYGSRRNKLQAIKMIRGRISSTRAELAAEKDPFKIQASKLIDEPNLSNLEKQLFREEKAVKQSMAQSFVARGSSGQTPQIVGGPNTPFLVPTLRGSRQKSNMLAGLPDLGDVGAMVSKREMRRMERNITRQPRRRSAIDKYLNFGGF